MTISRWKPRQRGSVRRRFALSAVILVIAFYALTAAHKIHAAALASRAPTRGSVQAGALSPAAAQSIIAKWRDLFDPQPHVAQSSSPVEISDVEANSYLKFDSSQILPHGIYNPQIRISRSGIQGWADVDFDELNRAQGQSSDIGTVLLGQLFRGRQHVTAVGKLATWNRQGRLTFQDVHVGSTTLSDWLTNWLLQTYVESKYKIDLSKPFALPEGVTRIKLFPGRAVFERAPAQKR
jgi:hypothetical protein